MCNRIDILLFSKPLACHVVSSVCRLAWIENILQREHESTLLPFANTTFNLKI